MSNPEGDKKRVRKRNWTPADRAAHRVFEKSRRDAFNDGMIDLARQIPSLKGTRRLNKHMIVEHSIARHKAQRELCLSSAKEVRSLLNERNELLAEVNIWRVSSSMPVPPTQPSEISSNVQALLDVEHESFATFPGGFGDNPPGGSTLDGDLRRDPSQDETWTDLADIAMSSAQELPILDENNLANFPLLRRAHTEPSPQASVRELLHSADLLNVGMQQPLYEFDDSLGMSTQNISNVGLEHPFTSFSVFEDMGVQPGLPNEFAPGFDYFPHQNYLFDKEAINQVPPTRVGNNTFETQATDALQQNMP